MAAWFRAVFLFLLPLALADTGDLPCEGFEVLQDFGLVDLESPSQFGVKVLESLEEVASDHACWDRCCQTANCDLAVLSRGKCHLVRCTLKEFNMCELTEQEGVRSYRRLESGVKPIQEDYCLPEAETGPCRGRFERWSYDAETQSCKNFTYGGCPTNLNNHAGEEECLKKCSGVKAVKSSSDPEPSYKRLVAADTLSERCTGPGVTGYCRAAFPRWYFNTETLSCMMFTYGGCGGSKNNHWTEEECLNACQGVKPEPSSVQSTQAKSFKEYCAAPPVTGNCRAAFRRWHYDFSSGVCKSFIYGGCNQNKNNYMSESDCRNMCVGRTEDDDSTAGHSVLHHSVTAVLLPILLALLAASLFTIMVIFFVRMAKKNQQASTIRAMWNPIDDKECLMNNAYVL